jgi:hypothetical protein
MPFLPELKTVGVDLFIDGLSKSARRPLSTHKKQNVARWLHAATAKYFL